MIKSDVKKRNPSSCRSLLFTVFFLRWLEGGNFAQHTPPNTSTSFRHLVAGINAIRKPKTISTLFLHLHPPIWWIHPFFLVCAHHKNLQPIKPIAPLRCENICHQKTENGFNIYLYFPNSSHSFQTVSRPWTHFRSEEKPKYLYFRRFFFWKDLKYLDFWWCLASHKIDTRKCLPVCRNCHRNSRSVSLLVVVGGVPIFP